MNLFFFFSLTKQNLFLVFGGLFSPVTTFLIQIIYQLFQVIVAPISTNQETSDRAVVIRISRCCLSDHEDNSKLSPRLSKCFIFQCFLSKGLDVVATWTSLKWGNLDPAPIKKM